MKSIDRSGTTAAIPSAEYDSSGSFASYLEYNKILRTWFVAFGVGGPALFLVNKDISEKLLKVGTLELVAVFFLMGVAAQVLGALVNKYANWYVYRSADDLQLRPQWKCKLAEWLIEKIWIDMFLDLITVAAFGAASWLMLNTFVS